MFTVGLQEVDVKATVITLPQEEEDTKEPEPPHRGSAPTNAQE